MFLKTNSQKLPMDTGQSLIGTLLHTQYPFAEHSIIVLPRPLTLSLPSALVNDVTPRY